MRQRPFMPAARYHVAGLTERGPLDQTVLLTTGAEYTAIFGERTPESAALYDDVGLFLAEGGTEVLITRVPTLDPATVRAALDAAGPVTHSAAVAVPGAPASVIGGELAAHAGLFGKTALLCGEKDTLPENLAATAAGLVGTTGSHTTGVFWPWVVTGDGRTLAPTGYVAAVRARAHFAHGYWKHPDGPDSRARTLTGLRFPNTPARNEELSEQLISPLVTTHGGVHLHGWWSLAGDRANFPYLDTADLLNGLSHELGEAYQGVRRHVWDTIPRLVSQINAITRTKLGSLANAGALRPLMAPDGYTADPGYRFTVTAPTEQPEDRNVITVRVYVRPYTHANLIGVRVFRVPILDEFPQEVAA